MEAGPGPSGDICEEPQPGTTRRAGRMGASRWIRNHPLQMYLRPRLGECRQHPRVFSATPLKPSRVSRVAKTQQTWPQGCGGALASDENPSPTPLPMEPCSVGVHILAPQRHTQETARHSPEFQQAPGADGPGGAYTLWPNVGRGPGPAP